MPVEIRLPQLADEMSVAKVGAWLKREGDLVRAGEPIVEIETDKTNVEIEAPVSGYLQQIVVPAGSDDVAVNTVLALIADERADIEPVSIFAPNISVFAPDPEPDSIWNRLLENPAGRTPNQEPERIPNPERQRTLTASAEGYGESAEALARRRNPAPSTQNPEPPASPITPLAREIARLAGLDLSTVRAASGGRITRHDVEHALGHDGPATSTALQPEPATEVPAAQSPAPLPELLSSEPVSAAEFAPAAESAAHIEPTPSLEPTAPSKPVAAPEPAAAAPAPAASAVAVTTSDTTPDAPRDVSDEAGLFDVQPLTNVRRVTAKRLQEAKQTVPHFYLEAECQVDALIELRSRWNARHADAKLTVTDFVVFAASRALVQVPQANAAWGETAVHVYRSVDIAVAVNTAKGLLTPIVRACHRKSVVVISREIAALAERARAGHLRPDDYTGATFTVSNLGMYGVTSITPIINPPAACILGVGTIEERPVVSAGQVVPGHTMRCALAADHRAVDGALGAELMTALRRLLEDPLALMLEG